jgi:hypothetical protein
VRRPRSLCLAARGMMIKHKTRKHLNLPRETIFRTLRDRQVEINEQLPNIVRHEIIRFEHSGEALTEVQAEIQGRTMIPFLLSGIVSQEHLRWFSHQVWNEEDYSCAYRIESLHFRDNVDISGYWKFIEAHRGTEISIDSNIGIDARGVRGIPPGLAVPAGILAERIILGLTGPSLDRILNGLREIARAERTAGATGGARNA